MPADDILKFASNCYEFDVNTLEYVLSGSNLVYKFQKNRKRFYLRIGERPLKRILAEIEWMTYLQKEIKTPAVIKSKSGKFAETFNENGKVYSVCVFNELQGSFWDKNDESKWNSTTFYNWGKVMGKMHCLTKQYNPGESRALFVDENYFYSKNAIKCVPTVYRIMEQIVNEIENLPRDNDSYGLIHSDLHQQNFLIGNNEINVLDFDDCMYGWFALDISIALYHALWWGVADGISCRNEFALTIINNFLKGYLSQNSLSDFWLAKIYLFMRYRQINVLGWFVKPDNINKILDINVFNVQYDVAKNISYIENGIFFENCKINEKCFINVSK